MVGNFILRLPWNIEDSLVIPTRELTEDIDGLLSLLSTATNTGVDRDGIHDTEEDDDYYSAMDDINDSESVSCAEKYYVDENLADEEVEELEDARKERMELMAAYSKPNFANIWRGLPNLGQLI